jgi:hypothetical protein
VYFAEDLFARLPVHWMCWPALGGLVIGIGGLIEPRALGVGYDVIDQLLTGHDTQALIIGILVVKTAIWSLLLGSGASGDVLAPVFMIAASLGAEQTSRRSCPPACCRSLSSSARRSHRIPQKSPCRPSSVLHCGSLYDHTVVCCHCPVLGGTASGSTHGETGQCGGDAQDAGTEQGGDHATTKQ